MIVADKPKSVDTQAKLALMLGVSERQIRNYIRDGMPGQQGYYDVEDCRDWVSRNVNSPGESVGGNLKEERLKAEVRKLRADAEQKELKNQQTRGELLHRDDVLQQVSEAFLMVKTRLECVPDEIEMQIPPEIRADVKAEVASRVRMVLMEMAAFQLEGVEEESEKGEQ